MKTATIVSGILIAMTVILILIILVGCHALNKAFHLPDDNPIEELAEAAIKASTGEEIDLTPNSPTKE